MITFLPSHTITFAALTTMARSLVATADADQANARVLTTLASEVYREDHNGDTAAALAHAAAHWSATRDARAFLVDSVLPAFYAVVNTPAPTQGNLYHAQRMLEKGRDALANARRLA